MTDRASSYPDNGGDGVLVDYDESDAAPPTGLLEEVRRLAFLQVEQEAAVDAAAAELERRKAALRRTRESDLPEAFAAAHMTAIELDDGTRIESAPTVHASIPKDRNDEAMDWFESEGRGSIVKTTITVRVPKGGEETTERILKGLNRLNETMPTKSRFELVRKREIHPQTLLKFVRDEAEAGRAEELPKALLGFFRRTVTKVIGRRVDPLDEDVAR